MQPASTLVLTDADVRRRLPLPELIDAIDLAFREEYDARRSPLRSRFSAGNRTVLIMPCQAENAIGIKTVLMTQEPGRAPRACQASYTFHALDGSTKAFLDANAMTELRTAATSAAATRALARSDASVLGIFGTGAIADAHVAAMLLVRPFTHVLVCGSSREKSDGFARRVEQRYAVQASAVDAESCAAQSSVLCTCTTATQPLFSGNALKPGTHINAVGCFTAECREVDSHTVSRSRLVVDTYGALEEAGDLRIPLDEGSIGRDHVLGDLQSALRTPTAIRAHGDDITLFKSVGCALEDMAAARLLLHGRALPDERE